MATGNDLLKIAAKHIGEKYILGATVHKNNPNWKGPWDCAEFISWVVYQASGILYGCDNDSGSPSSADAFTGYWGRDAKKKGDIIKISEATSIPGAAVLRLASPDIKVGHIVFSDGNGGTIEAHSKATGVIRSTLSGRRWDMGILVPGITYTKGKEIVVKDSPKVYRLTSPMMKGDTIEKIQQKLADLGFDPGDIDGKYGSMTAAAVSNFQAEKDLVVDGEAGPETLKALGIS